MAGRKVMSSEAWKRHFSRMAGMKSSDSDEVYIVGSAQQGRGLGRQAFGNTVYKIRPNVDESTPRNVEIVSPVAQAVAQAKALTKERKKSIKGAGGKAKPSKGAGTSRKKVVQKTSAAKRKNRSY